MPSRVSFDSRDPPAYLRRLVLKLFAPPKAHPPMLRTICLVALTGALLVPAVLASAEQTYGDIVRRLYDLEGLATPPPVGERSGSVSSRDRRARFDVESGKYESWDAHRDSLGLVRKEGGGIVAADLRGPGVIWRVWTAEAGAGHMKIFVDGAEEPALDIPFRDYFQSDSGPFAYSALVHVLSKGHNSYIPVPFQKSCRVVLEKDWGRFYQISYTSFPEGTKLPSYDGSFDDAEKAALAEAQTVLSARGQDPKPTTNDDSTSKKTLTLRPGKSTRALKLEGAGAITQIRIDPQFRGDPISILRELTLSIRWDGESSPSVWAPLGDFFGSAPGLNRFRALPVGMDDDRFYAYWFLPFSKGAVLSIRNDGKAARKIALRVTHRKLDASVTDKLLRFHAKWHRDSFAGVDETSFTRGDRWPDWPVLVANGSGRFCGMHLHVWNPNHLGRLSQDFDVDLDGLSFRVRDAMKQAAFRRSWGDGDEKFFVDGEENPSTFGTGTEHYFGHASSGHDAVVFETALQCQPLNRRSTGHISNSRFQIADNVPFQTRFEGVLEKLHTNSWPLRYAVTAYWYQRAGESDLYGVVPAKDRVDYYDAPERWLPMPDDGSKYDAETHFGYTPPARVQGMRHFGPHWSGHAHILWDGKVGEEATLDFSVRKTGKYELVFQLTRAPDYGKFDISIDGKVVVRDFDTYAPRVELAPKTKPVAIDLKSGVHSVSFRLSGSNPKAHPYREKKYLLGFDYLQMTRK